MDVMQRRLRQVCALFLQPPFVFFLYFIAFLDILSSSGDDWMLSHPFVPTEPIRQHFVPAKGLHKPYTIYNAYIHQHHHYTNHHGYNIHTQIIEVKIALKVVCRSEDR